jgi:S-methylmethionine-dependent homocysteine/selenocysteine methylase
MAKSQTTLPHKSSELFLTDGGLETTLLFLDGFELPGFAAFDLLKDEKGYKGIADYYTRYLRIAKNFKTNFILESATWRANPDWIEKLGYPGSAILEINKKAVELLVDLKNKFEDDIPTIVISGCVGPRGDGYKPGSLMNAAQAGDYHSKQIEALSSTPIDLITAITMNYAEEAIGVTHAANAVGLPVIISFTVETNGKLPTGMSLKEAIGQVDKSVKEPPVYYMINCAHPTHFINELQAGLNEEWINRIKGIRANASCKSHAELDESTQLDRGNPKELAAMNKHLKSMFNQLNVFGGCCGTDDEHIFEIGTQIKTV